LYVPSPDRKRIAKKSTRVQTGEGRKKSRVMF
jgi:hypothetical protein